MIENYKSHFELKSKHIFVPSEECVRKGQILIAYIGRCVTFPEFFFHYRSGGHVATLHEHLRRRFFFRIDIKNFYYAISRSRVTKIKLHLNKAVEKELLEFLGYGKKEEYPEDDYLNIADLYEVKELEHKHET